MRKLFAVLLSLMAFMVFGPGSAEAFKFGAFDAGLDLSVAGKYDDNVFVTNGNEVDDFFFVISPGVYINNAQDRNNEISLRYNADIYRYTDTGSLSDTEDHFVEGLIHLNKDGRIRLKVSDGFARRHENREDSFLSTGRITQYYSNDLEAEVGVVISEKFEFALNYNWLLYDYSEAFNSYRDRYDNAASLTAFYRMLPKMKLLVQGVYKNVDHHNNDTPLSAMLDSDEIWVMTGVTWDITEKSTGVVKVGYEWKDMDSSMANDFSTAIYIVGIRHEFTPKTAVSLTGTRRAMETDDPNSQYYSTTTGYLNVSLHPVRKLLVSPYAAIVHDRYQGATTVFGDTARRIENTYTAGIDLGYEINEWVDFKVGYQHSKRSSTVTNYDFTKNLVTVMITGRI